jgi:hypothetical protein
MGNASLDDANDYVEQIATTFDYQPRRNDETHWELGNQYFPKYEVTARVEFPGYVTYVTTAPAAFDDFGTLAIREVTLQHLYNQHGRIIMVKEEHLEWQRMRNLSGMYLMMTLREAIDEGYLQLPDDARIAKATVHEGELPEKNVFDRPIDNDLDFS